uniref:Ribonucleoside-diphosphate reductase n=1 Tax=Globodera pallida TaxID=36090 RepID=A0A183CR70_GLOPA
HMDGTVPLWMATAGLQMFNEKYLYEAANPREQYMRIARTAAKHAPQALLPGSDEGKFKGYMQGSYDNYEEYWTDKFFEVMWNGWMACSTPVLANMGTNRGCSVSCAGSEVHDSVNGFYSNLREMSLLSKEGFGTASDLSGVRKRGSRIKGGGKASGVMPVRVRRGAWAAYLNIMHGDFWEVIAHLEKEPDDFNMGWIIDDEFVAKLNAGNKEAHKRFKRAMRVKMVTGKGYFFFIDKVNRNRPEMYKDLGLMVKASQLCTEIFLHSDAAKYTYTCVLAWMNMSKWDEWKDTDAVYVATVFLDCVVSEFIEQAKQIPGLEKAVAATEAGRAIGLGAGGYHTYLQSHMIPYESIDAQMWNIKVFKQMKEQSMDASRWLAKELGEPEWCKGYGVRFTHNLAVAPTKSTALIYGGIEEGINTTLAMSYTQKTSAGDVDRKCIADVVKGYGSVQHVDWLDDLEKQVFKVGFEIDMRVHIRKAAARQKYLDQGQSLNLAFGKNVTEKEIAVIHKEAFENEWIHSLYYIQGSRSVVSSKSECESCQ